MKKKISKSDLKILREVCKKFREAFADIDEMCKYRGKEDDPYPTEEELKEMGSGLQELARKATGRGVSIETKTFRITEEFIERWARKACFTPFPTDDFLIRTKEEIRGCLEEAWRLWVSEE